MKQLTMEWAKSVNACQDGLDWWKTELNLSPDPETVIKALMTTNRFDWANWLTTKLLTNNQKALSAIFAAEQVIGIYEKQYPGDDRPRKVIEAAKKVLRNELRERTKLQHEKLEKLMNF